MSVGALSKTAWQNLKLDFKCQGTRPGSRTIMSACRIRSCFNLTSRKSRWEKHLRLIPSLEETLHRAWDTGLVSKSRYMDSLKKNAKGSCKGTQQLFQKFLTILLACKGAWLQERNFPVHPQSLTATVCKWAKGETTNLTPIDNLCGTVDKVLLAKDTYRAAWPMWNLARNLAECFHFHVLQLLSQLCSCGISHCLLRLSCF